MARIVDETHGTVIELALSERMHWTLGRGGECDLQVVDPGVSRFHATVFSFDQRFYMLDHSLNGTHLTKGAGIISEATRVPSFSPSSLLDHKPRVKSVNMQDTHELQAVSDEYQEKEKYPALHQSHIELRMEQSASRLPRMAGYQAHTLCVPDDMQPLLKMVYSADEVQILVSMSRRMQPGLHLVLVGCSLHSLLFEE